MNSEPVTHEVLLQHAGFLRRLAHDLVGDAAAADDAVQAVWLRALERPPRHTENVRGWLRVVLTNLVRTRARDDARRAQRERERAVCEDAHAIESAEGEETLRAVTDAVLALDEPLRTILLQHYFQGVPVAVIAERAGVAVSTVKSQLQRALERLRARLARERGATWRHALVVFAAPRAGDTAGALTGSVQGGLLVSTKTKLVAACAAVALGFGAYQVLDAEPPSSASRSDVSATHSVGAPTRAATDDVVASPAEASTAERAALARTSGLAPASATAPARPRALFFGALLDPAGQPLRGLWSAGVALTDAEGRRSWCDAKAAGSFAFAGLARGKYSVEASADGYWRIEREVELDSDIAVVERDFTLTPAPVLKIKVSTPDGKNLLDELRSDPAFGRIEDVVPVATATHPGPWFTEVVGSLNNPFGIGQFWQYGPRVSALPDGYLGIVVVQRPLPAFVSLVNHHRVLQTKVAEAGAEEIEFVLARDDVASSLANVRMRIIDADTGAPLPGARVMLDGTAMFDGGVVTDAEGLIAISGRPPGEYDLRASSKGHATHDATLKLESGANELGDIALAEEVAVTLQIVDTSGAPRSQNFQVGRVDPRSNVLTVSTTYAYGSKGDGKLELRGLGRGLYVLRSSNHDALNDAADATPQLVSGNVVLDLRAGGAPKNAVVKLLPATRVSIGVAGGADKELRLRVVDEQGWELVAGRYWSRGARVLALPPGTYHVELLDAQKRTLAEQSVTVGAEPVTVELARQ